jgi:hypothetical protein
MSTFVTCARKKKKGKFFFFFLYLCPLGVHSSSLGPVTLCCILLLPFSLVFSFSLNSQKGRQGRQFVASSFLLLHFNESLRAALGRIAIIHDPPTIVATYPPWADHLLNRLAWLRRRYLARSGSMVASPASAEQKRPLPCRLLREG